MLIVPLHGFRSQCPSEAPHGNAATAQSPVHIGFLRFFACCAAINLAKIVRALQAIQRVLGFGCVEVGVH